LTNNIIVTGGAGFIGANLVVSLFKKGFKVHVFDNLSTGNIKNLNLNEINFYKIDLKNNHNDWPKINASKIYHLAANADVRGGLIDHEVDFNENLVVTKNVCDYAVQNNIKDIIFASSATVYGEPNIFPTPETFSSNQTSLYGASKISCESFIEAYSNYKYFKSSIFRFVSWTGKGYSHGVIYDFVKKLLCDPHTLEILGDGKQVKSYLDVKDGVKALLDIPNSHNEDTCIFNLGHDEKMNVIDLADIVCDEMKLTNTKYFFKGGRRGWIGDSPLVHLDTTKVKKYGWSPIISIEESIRETVRYLINNKSNIYR